MAKKRLGEILIERGLIDVDQLNSALAYHRQWGHRLGASMVAKGFIREGTLTRVLSEALQIPMVDLAKVIPDDKALVLIKATQAEEQEIFPIAVKEHKGRKTLLLAMVDPLNVAAIDEVAFTTDMTVRPAIAQITSLRAAIRRYYHREQIHIPPLDFGPPRRGAVPGAAPAGERMTITVGGTEREVIVDEENADVIDLTKEVEAAESATGSGMVQITSAQPPAPLPWATPTQGDPFAMVSTTSHQTYYQGQPTGAYMMAVPAAAPAPAPQPQAPPLQNPRLSLSFDAPPVAPVETPHEALEKKFWALMRILARKGLLTREEFIEELARE
jgi:hypothetical protein